MDVLQIFGSWDQEIDSWFTNHEPLIPTLFSIFCFWIASYSAFNLRSSFLCSDSSSSLLIKNEKPYCRFPFFVLVLVIIIFISIPGFRKSLNSFVSFFQLVIYQHPPTPPPPQVFKLFTAPPTGNGCFCIFHAWLFPTSTCSYFWSYYNWLDAVIIDF